MLSIKKIKFKLRPLKKKITKFTFIFTKYNKRRRLKNQNFSIISNNCWGGMVYEELGLPYLTPFIGLYIFSPDYIKMLKEFESYMKYELKFVQSSKWVTDYDHSYPIGILNDIEIHFLHYSNEIEAFEKWNRRKNRINYSNLFFKFNDDNQSSYELMKEFDGLNFKNKVLFSAVDYKLESLVYFKKARGNGHVGPDLFYYSKYFDVVEWLNEGGFK